MKELKDAENLFKNITLGNSYFDNLMIGLDQDSIILNYSFRMNSFSYHIKPVTEELFEFSNKQNKESEMQIDKDVFIRSYSNKNIQDKEIGTLENALSTAVKSYSISRIKSVKQFFEDEANDFGNEKDALKGFISVFKEHFKDLLINDDPNSIAVIGNNLKAAATRINDIAIIKFNNEIIHKKVENDFDTIEALFENVISHYIDDKIKNNFNFNYLNENNKKSKNKRKLH